MTNDPFNDPRFPDRPTHADFWALSNVALYNDGEISEGGRTVEDVIAEVIDPESLVYMAQQRASILLVDRGLPLLLVPLLQGIFVDAFLMGHSFRAMK